MYESADTRQTEGNQTAQSVRRTLASHMAKSRRNGSWFRLSSMERGILSLSLRLKVTFESAQLAKALVSVLNRLAELGDAVYSQLIAGTRIALAFADAAEGWGNRGASAFSAAAISSTCRRASPASPCREPSGAWSSPTWSV